MTELSSAGHEDNEMMISRRRHERVIAKGRVQATIRIPDYDANTYVMEILEVSPAGLRLRTPEGLEADKIDLVANIDGFAEAISLSTYVRWQEEDDQGYTLFGVEIDDTEESDLDTWCEFQREEWFKAKA